MLFGLKWSRIPADLKNTSNIICRVETQRARTRGGNKVTKQNKSALKDLKTNKKHSESGSLFRAAFEMRACLFIPERSCGLFQFISLKRLQAVTLKHKGLWVEESGRISSPCLESLAEHNRKQESGRSGCFLNISSTYLISSRFFQRDIEFNLLNFHSHFKCNKVFKP